MGTGLLTRFAGSSRVPGYAGDGGPALTARLNDPHNLAMDSAGTLNIVDAGNSVIQ